MLRALALATALLWPLAALTATLPATPATLASVVAKAAPTDTITLAPGFYGDRAFRRTVHLAATPGTLPPVFASLAAIQGSDGSTFDGLRVDLPMRPTTVTSTPAVRAVSVANVAFRGLVVSGPTATVEAGGNHVGFPTGQGYLISASHGVTISGGEVTNVMRGIGLNDAYDVTITRMNIHDLRGAPIDGSVKSNIEVSDNWLHDVRPWHWGLGGDHADFIHFWTEPNVAASDIRILRNTMDQGQGVGILGVLIENHGLGFTGLKVIGNTVLSSHAMAYNLNSAEGELTSNTALMVSGRPAHDAPSIYIAATSKIAISGNRAHDLTRILRKLPASQHNTVVPAAVQTPAVLDAARKASLAAGYGR